MHVVWFLAQGITTQGTLPNLTQIAASGGTTTVVGAKPRTSTENIQPKTSNNSTGISRPLSNILPSVPGNQTIRPASSVSTQTGVAQHLTQAQMQNQKAQVNKIPVLLLSKAIKKLDCKIGNKVYLIKSDKWLLFDFKAKMRAKPMIRAVGLAAGQKADAANQTKPQSISPQQQLTANK